MLVNKTESIQMRKKIRSKTSLQLKHFKSENSKSRFCQQIRVRFTLRIHLRLSRGSYIIVLATRVRFHGAKQVVMTQFGENFIHQC